MVTRALERDELAVELLCQRLRCVPRMVHALNQRLNSPLRPEDQRDVVQEILAIVWRKLPTFYVGSAFEAWVLGIARFQVLNAARRGRRRPEASAADLADVPALPLERSLERGERVDRALARLKPEESSVIRLYLFDEQSFEQIARDSNLSVSGVKNRYYRGLQALRMILSPTDPGEPA
jgi:RNA polymerase sigma-70 factor (ECF subfamily)